MSIWRVRVRFSGVPGSPWLATHYFDANAVGATAQAAANKTGALWQALDNKMTTGLTWTTDPIVDEVNPIGGAILSQASTTPVTGAGGTAVNMLPPHVQAYINWRTGIFVAGREVRGRTYYPALTEDNNTGFGVQTGVNDSSTQAAIATFIAATAPLPMIWSREHNQAASISSGTIPLKWASLRTRRD